MIKDLIRAGWTVKPPPATDIQLDRFIDDVSRLGSHQTLRLTGKELLAVKLAADGSTVAETARIVGLSSETVKTQLSRARRKLGARNMAHLVALALRAGIID